MCLSCLMCRQPHAKPIFGSVSRTQWALLIPIREEKKLYLNMLLGLYHSNWKAAPHHDTPSTKLFWSRLNPHCRESLLEALESRRPLCIPAYRCFALHFTMHGCCATAHPWKSHPALKLIWMPREALCFVSWLAAQSWRTFVVLFCGLESAGS